MRKILYLSLLISFISFSQQKKNWFFGMEIGCNSITSFEFGESNKSFQGGFLAEYYTGNHWSLIGRIKYFKTGVSFFKPNTHNGSWLDLGSDGFYGEFNGEVISVPITMKYEFKVLNKFRGNLKLGLAYNYETKSEYNFSSNLDSKNPKSFGSLNTGLGLSYYVSNKTAFNLDVESYQFGGYKANSSSDGSMNFGFPKNYYTTNCLINIGIKHNFKK